MGYIDLNPTTVEYLKNIREKSDSGWSKSIYSWEAEKWVTKYLKKRKSKY